MPESAADAASDRRSGGRGGVGARNRRIAVASECAVVRVPSGDILRDRRAHSVHGVRRDGDESEGWEGGFR